MRQKMTRPQAGWQMEQRSAVSTPRRRPATRSFAARCDRRRSARCDHARSARSAVRSAERFAAMMALVLWRQALVLWRQAPPPAAQSVRSFAPSPAATKAAARAPSPAARPAQARQAVRWSQSTDYWAAPVCWARRHADSEEARASTSHSGSRMQRRAHPETLTPQSDQARSSATVTSRVAQAARVDRRPRPPEGSESRAQRANRATGVRFARWSHQHRIAVSQAQPDSVAAVGRRRAPTARRDSGLATLERADSAQRADRQRMLARRGWRQPERRVPNRSEPHRRSLFWRAAATT